MIAPTTAALVAAYEAGQEVARAGARVDACPYRPRTATALTGAWLNGYVQERVAASGSISNR